MSTVSMSYRTIFILLIVATAGGIFFQSQRITPFMDYTYQVENAYRIYRGEFPYRDFFLVVSPGLYFLLSFIMHVWGGYTHITQIFFTVCIASLTIIFMERFLRLFIQNNAHVLFLLLALAVTIILYPFPSYDITAMAAILLALVIYFSNHASHPIHAFFSGIIITVPTLFKQNIGLAFILSVCLSIVVWIPAHRHKRDILYAFSLFAGIACGILCMLLWLYANGALPQAINQLFIFPGKIRQPIEEIRKILQEYFDFFLFFWPVIVTVTLSWLACMGFIHSTYIKKRLPTFSGTIIAFFVVLVILELSTFSILRILPLHIKDQKLMLFRALWITLGVTSVSAMIRSFILDRSMHIRTLFPLIALPTAHATFLSHGIAGSSYGLFPLIFGLFAYMQDRLQRTKTRAIGFTILTFLMSISVGTLLRSNSYLEQFNYIQTYGELTYATHPSLRFMATQGNWIPDFEELIAYTEEHIPKDEPVLYIPGEDPFYATTNRMPPFDFFQWSQFTYPFPIEDYIPRLTQKKINWVIIKNDVQIYYGFVTMTDYWDQLYPEFTVIDTLRYYMIFKRNSPI